MAAPVVSLDQSTIDLIRAIAELGVIPLIAVLWRLNSAISDLRVTLYRDFLTLQGHRTWHEVEKSALQNAPLNAFRPNDERF